MSGMSRTRRARRSEAVARAVTGLAAVSVVAVALFVLAYIVYHGIGAIDWTFLTDVPRDRGREGGILPVSIVYGLFGLAAFVLLAGFGRSVIASALTLTCMTLPVVITATEEALRQIPQDLRQASLALGATRLRTIYKVVLPAAAPGIITGSILGLARAAGETAPILFTGAVFQMRKLPDGLSSQFMSLPYHIYAQVTSVPGWSPTLVWGTALVLVAGVSVVSVVAALWRSAQRRRVKW
ncbi:MAG: Phosphate abc transporter, permease protein psta [Actinobacteria bacterium 66_15]|nr:MAG: Phosphate abc transporter, permease protein psta [Actinobacteria bacterium 66_15]